MSGTFLERFQDRIVTVTSDGSVRRLHPQPNYSGSKAESPVADLRPPEQQFHALSTDLRQEAVNSSFFKLPEEENFAREVVDESPHDQKPVRKVSVSDLKKVMSGVHLLQTTPTSRRTPQAVTKVVEDEGGPRILLEVWNHNATRAPKPLPRPTRRSPVVKTSHQLNVGQVKHVPKEIQTEHVPKEVLRHRIPEAHRKVRSYVQIHSKKAAEPNYGDRQEDSFSEGSTDEGDRDLDAEAAREHMYQYQNDGMEVPELDPDFDDDERDLPNTYTEIHATDYKDEASLDLQDYASHAPNSGEHQAVHQQAGDHGNLVVMDAKMHQRLRRLRRRKPDRVSKPSSVKDAGHAEEEDAAPARFRKNEEIVNKDPSQALYFSKQPRRVKEFRPYTLVDYRAVRPKEYMEVKPLPPDLESDELVAKRANYYRVKQFSTQLREFNRKVITSGPREPTRNVSEKQKARKISAREKALEFSRKVKPPKPKKKNEPDGEDEQGVWDTTAARSFSPSKLEILEANYEAQRAQVDAIRRELGTTNR